MEKIQEEFWLNKKRMKRRSPFHPVVTAYIQPKINFMKANINIKPEMTLLDVGCGNGYFTCHLAEICDVTGLDFSKVMLKINPHSKLVQGDVNSLPFANNIFDIVFCSDLLHHLSSPQKALAEMKRVSKKYIVISEPNRNNPLVFIFSVLKKEERGALKFTKTYLFKLFSELNLKVENVLTSSMIFPNKNPLITLSFLKIFDFNFFIGNSITIIAKKL